jgi:hypothetical protein
MCPNELSPSPFCHSDSAGRRLDSNHGKFYTPRLRALPDDIDHVSGSFKFDHDGSLQSTRSNSPNVGTSSTHLHANPVSMILLDANFLIIQTVDFRNTSLWLMRAIFRP